MADVDKYYTPTIEEFHVGFEFEMTSGSKKINNIGEVVEYSYSWNKETFNQNNNLDLFDYLLSLQGIRVKYLDKEDIESFGFTEQHLPNCFKEDDDIELGYGLQTDRTRSIIIHTYNNQGITIGEQVVYNQISGNWYFSHLFKGIIKNKSELKVLLKQLGI